MQAEGWHVGGRRACRSISETGSPPLIPTIGMLLVIPGKKFKKAQSVLDRAGEKAYTVGRIVKGDRKVMYS